MLQLTVLRFCPSPWLWNRSPLPPRIKRARLGDDKNIASSGARVLRELPEVTGPESELRSAAVH